jgi:hypothetical protein
MSIVKTEYHFIPTADFNKCVIKIQSGLDSSDNYTWIQFDCPKFVLKEKMYSVKIEIDEVNK